MQLEEPGIKLSLNFILSSQLELSTSTVNWKFVFMAYVAKNLAIIARTACATSLSWKLNCLTGYFVFLGLAYSEPGAWQYSYSASKEGEV